MENTNDKIEVKACPAPVCSTRRRTVEDLLAECWHGRAWHRLSNLEGAIFDKLKDAGEMYYSQGFIYRVENPSSNDQAHGARETK